MTESASSSSWGGSPTSFLTRNTCLGGGGRCIRVCGGGVCCYGVLVLGKCAGDSQRKY